jgi:hypothetical protein
LQFLIVKEDVEEYKKSLFEDWSNFYTCIGELCSFVNTVHIFGCLGKTSRQAGAFGL